MRKFVMALFAFAFLSFSQMYSVHAQNSPYGDEGVVRTASTQTTTGAASQQLVIDRAWVNVRTGPGTENSILKSLPQGTKGTKIVEKNGWYLIDFGNGVKGWVRGDLVADRTVPTPPAGNVEKAALNKSFERWDRHLGNSYLSFDKIPWYWKLGRAKSALEEGNFQKAYELAQADDSKPLLARYVMAKALYGMGKFAEAKKTLDTIEKTLEDCAFLQVMDKISKPYIDEPVVFKFGGYDDLPTYRMKKAKEKRLGLNSAEYYERFVDIKTWNWKSKEAYKEFQEIGGIDCSGFVQRVQLEAFQQAKVPFPISGRTSTSGLYSGKYAKSINPGVRPPPPPDIRPGDMILLDYGHNRYGHSMIYRGMDSAGNIRVVMMGDTAVESILAPEKFEFYKGTYRMNGMDQVRKTLTA